MEMEKFVNTKKKATKTAKKKKLKLYIVAL